MSVTANWCVAGHLRMRHHFPVPPGTWVVDGKAECHLCGRPSTRIFQEHDEGHHFYRPHKESVMNRTVEDGKYVEERYPH